MTRYLKGGHPKLCLEERNRQVNARRRNIGLQPDDKIGIDVDAPKCSNEEPKAPDCKKCRRSSPATAEKPPLPKGYGYLPLASGVDMDGNYWEILSDRTAFMSCARCGKKGDHRVANCPSLNKDKSESVVATAEKPPLPKGYCYLPLASGVDENGNYWEKLSDRTAFMVCTLCGKEGDHRVEKCPNQNKDKCAPLSESESAAATTNN